MSVATDPGNKFLIREVGDRNFEEVVAGAERAVLILTKTGCGHCAAYQAEIEALLKQGQLGGIAVGKMVLDRRGVIRDFKRENPWLAGLNALPYTVLYAEGRRVDGFAASKGGYLLERIEDVFARSPS
jgi:thioredoxin-like negative regulator of GroEL